MGRCPRRWQQNIRNLQTQGDAIDFAKPLSKKDEVELSIHQTDGTIRDKRSYGNYPYHPQG
jgi:hypothetical protein